MQLVLVIDLWVVPTRIPWPLLQMDFPEARALALRIYSAKLSYCFSVGELDASKPAIS